MSQDKFQEIQLVIFKIGNEEFGVPISQVREIVRLIPITPVPHAPDFIEGVVNLRGKIVAVIDLARRLKLKAAMRSDTARIIVVEVEEDTVGMIVDEVTEVLRITQENIEQTPELIAAEIHQKYIKGVGKLGERLIILIDLLRIFSSDEIEGIKKTKLPETKKEENDGREKTV